MNPNKPKKTSLNKQGLQNQLEVNGITVRQNVITKEIEFEGVPEVIDPDDVLNDLPIWIHDVLKEFFSCSKDQIIDLLILIAKENRFNPVDEILKEVKWDRYDRISDLYRIMGITEDSLSKKLVEKWLWMAWEMAHNDSHDPEGADGMLVLVGAQGIGKTSLVRKLGLDRRLYRLGTYIDTKDKDTLKRATSAWIVELAEIETTLRGDLDRLKAFITAERDEIRLPYARNDRRTARRSVFIGTCNEDRFLVDPTGSRRFWTVPVKSIDLEELKRLDAKQLWAQVVAEGRLFKRNFRLTKEEQAALAKRNTEHERPLKAQVEVEDILSEATRKPDMFAWRQTTVSEFKEAYPSLKPYSAEQIGRACDKLGIKMTRVSVDGKQNRTRKLPFYKWGVGSNLTSTEDGQENSQ